MIKCRACLKDDGSMVPFTDQHINYFNLLTNIQVQLCDKLPQHLCLCCCENIKSFIEFRQKCILSNYLLIESSESKHKIEIEMTGSDKSDELRSETIKLELCSENIDETLEDDSIEHLKYNLINDLIKTENIEEPIRTSKRKRITKLNPIQSKRKTTSKNISFELKTTSEIQQRKTKSTKNSVVKSKESVLLCDLKTTSKRKTKSTKNSASRTKDSVLLCGLCSETFPEARELCLHLVGHESSGACRVCRRVFADWPALLAHRLTHLTSKLNHCHICLKKFYNPLNMEFHYRKFHTEDKDYVVKCSKCSHTFKSPRELQKHTWSSHSDKRFSCEHCGKEFKSKTAIRSHLAVHNTRPRLLCELCDYTCRFTSNLRDHKLRKHTPKKTYCKMCTRVFSNQEKLDSHQCGEKGTICNICGKVGKNHRQLLRHLASHDSTPRHKCLRCPKEFRSRSSLVTHTLRHDGLRTKHCEYCSATFYSGSVLIKHRRTHTGERPYVCQVCCKGFTGRHNLKVHMRVHGEYLIEKKKSDGTDTDQ